MTDIDGDFGTGGPAAPDRRQRADAARAIARPLPSGAATELRSRQAPRINLSVRLGPMVRFDVQGESCNEIADALCGFDRLNQVVDEMFSDLAVRIYPDGEVPDDTGEEAAG